ncbi:hypothetical protein ACRAWD_15475 [Caulobacter segnis]
MLKTYTGSCHYGAVRYEADIDLSAGTGRCNCSICKKTRNWGALIKPDALPSAGGRGRPRPTISSVRSAVISRSAAHAACAHSATAMSNRSARAFVSICVNTLDDVTPEELAAAPINYGNGRDNLWWEQPCEAEMRYL